MSTDLWYVTQAPASAYLLFHQTARFLLDDKSFLPIIFQTLNHIELY